MCSVPPIELRPRQLGEATVGQSGDARYAHSIVSERPRLCLGKPPDLRNVRAQGGCRRARSWQHAGYPHPTTGASTSRTGASLARRGQQRAIRLARKVGRSATRRACRVRRRVERHGPGGRCSSPSGGCGHGRRRNEAARVTVRHLPVARHHAVGDRRRDRRRRPDRRTWQRGRCGLRQPDFSGDNRKRSRRYRWWRDGSRQVNFSLGDRNREARIDR